MKNSSDTIGNRTRSLPTCTAVPQPTVPPAACPSFSKVTLLIKENSKYITSFGNFISVRLALVLEKLQEHNFLTFPQLS